MNRKWCRFLAPGSVCGLSAKVLTWHDGKFEECERCNRVPAEDTGKYKEKKDGRDYDSEKP